VGQAVGAAVGQFLTTPGIGSELGTIIGSVAPDFLDQTGIPAALANAAGQLATAFIAGDLASVLPVVEAQLWANPDVEAAVKTTVADVLNLVDTIMLSNPVVQQALGTITANLITGLAGDPTVRAFVGDEIGPPFGDAIANLLADSTVVNDLASAFGSAIPAFLSYPGFSTVLTDAVDQFANAVLDGTAVPAALQASLQWLEANATFRAAVETIVPNVVETLLANPDVRAAAGVLAKQVVIAALQQAGIDNQLLDGLAGQVVGGTVDALLLKTAVVGLIDTLAVNVLEGMALSDITTVVVQEVIDTPALQVAVGFSIGQGIGSLFGDNLIGDFIGLAAAIPATLVIGMAAGIAQIYQWLFGRPNLATNLAVTGQALPAESRSYQPLPSVSDLFSMTASIPHWHDTDPSSSATISDGQITLTSTAVDDPSGDQPGSVDIAMSMDSAGVADSQTPEAPLRVSFRFQLDGPLPVLERSALVVADTRAPRRVG